MTNQVGTILGYEVIEDNKVKKIRLPKSVIELLSSTTFEWIDDKGCGE